MQPPLVPQLWGTCLDAVAHGGNPQDRAASLDSFVPPRIGGLGGRNHTQNQQRPYLLPAPDSRFPIPDSRFPTPDSRLPPSNRKPQLGATGVVGS
ncbi:MAG: hypothetical protein F6J98_19780 [Moorea sp. SIO4G2]|uniref:hypothetical protein n=1 Tax=Moorena sp. SIO3F7 TaxID=2607839 RepID=UPI0013FB0A42|nr:hypothetical protein [Moorena sp. SIO3F7]NEO62549.1 hypothetical protein [Moorena sp. SIO4G2]